MEPPIYSWIWETSGKGSILDVLQCMWNIQVTFTLVCWMKNLMFEESRSVVPWLPKGGVWGQEATLTAHPFPLSKPSDDPVRGSRGRSRQVLLQYLGGNREPTEASRFQ